MSLKSLTLKAAIVFIIFLPTAVLAEAEVEGRDYHIVVKGDTLWDISQKYMSNPFFWPKLWQWNDYITNPHFIYPGNKIRLIPPKVVLKPLVPTVEEVAVEPAPTPEGTVEELTEELTEEPAPKVIIDRQKYNIRHLRSSGMISPEEMKASGKIVEARDEKVMFGDGDNVYIALNSPVENGEILAVFKPTTEIIHPITKEYLGHKIERLGHIKVIDSSEGITTGEIIESFNVISREDKVMMKEDLPEEITIKEVSLPIEGRIVTALDNISVYGQNDVVFTDLGKSDGVEEGYLFTIYRPAHQEGKYKLPAETIGRLLIFQVKEKTSTAIIVDAVEEVRAGEMIKAVLQ